MVAAAAVAAGESLSGKGFCQGKMRESRGPLTTVQQDEKLYRALRGEDRYWRIK